MLEARSLSKAFGRVLALRRVSLAVAAGEAVAITGPNGAGKSTLFSCLAGALRPDEGEVRMTGGRCGALLQQPMLYPDLTGMENLQLYCVLLEIASPAARIAELDGELELGAALERKVKHCSQGMAKRLGLARALLHAPELLLLDEPFSGLDPQGKERLLGLLCARRDAGGAVALTTHEPELLRGAGFRFLRLCAGRLGEND